jgi:homoserine O-succinyltransferase/O-acetyltransferase
MPVCMEYPRYSACLEIGLINNMPPVAMEATERQFRTLLDAASDGIAVKLTLFALPEARGCGENSIYSSIAELWDRHLDGLIVTGTEPRKQDLADEPYWGCLTAVLDWAERSTHSSVWSCLAAHAGLLWCDGIKRKPLAEKLFGVFDCASVAEDPLTSGLKKKFSMPHSRWNGISESALAECGYRILTRSDDAGVDTFVKRRKSLFLFFQGHPEYEADTLLLEYRRDIRRFLRYERETYPAMPRGYFDEYDAAELDAVRQKALSERREELLPDFPTAVLAARLRNTWRPAAVRMYRNWLLYLCEQQESALKSRVRAGQYTNFAAVPPDMEL